jgi:hypothetical protein
MREIEPESYEAGNLLLAIFDELDLDNRTRVEASLLPLLLSVASYEQEHPGVARSVLHDITYYLEGIANHGDLMELANERAIDMGLSLHDKDANETFVIVGGDGNENNYTDDE